MKRLLTLLATLTAVAFGAWGYGPNVTPTAPDGLPAHSWGARNGFDWIQTRKLTATSHYVIHDYRREDGCALSAAPLGNADEVMAVLRGRATESDRAQSRLLIASLGPMPESALGVHIRRLTARLTEGHAPQPVMIVAQPHCLSAASGAPLSPWPAL